MQTTLQKPFFRLAPLLLLIFLDSFSYFIVIPILLQLFYSHRYTLLPLSAHLETRDIVTGITIAVAPFAALLFSPLIGMLSDQYGRKKTLLGCLCCIISGFTLPIIGILRNNIVFLLLGRFLAGAGSASQPIAQAAVSDLCVGKKRAFYLSLIALMMTLAMILGPLVGSTLINTNLSHQFTLITPYEFSLLLSIFNLLLILFCFRETKSPEKNTSPSKRKTTVTDIFLFTKQYKIGWLMARFFLLELGWSQYYQTIQLYLKLHWHFTSQSIGLFNATLGITMSFGLLLLYPLLLRSFSIQKIMRFSLMGVLIGLLGCSIFYSVVAQWLFANLVSIFTGCAYVSLVACIADKTDDQHHGLVMGFLSTALYCAWMLTAFNGGWLISWYDKLPIFIATLFLLFAGLIRNKSC